MGRGEWRTIGAALALALAPALAEVGGAAAAGDRAIAETSADRIGARLLGPEDTLQDLLDHPALAGFARRTLPWDDRAYDGRMRLGELGTLLPYHSRVEPEAVVGGLNRLIGDASTGRTVFYDFYGPARRRADPTKENAGLFFVRGRPGAPFAVIAPGGGFAYVGSVHEGFPYAEAIARRGYNAFVLKYRAGLGQRAATEDLAAAVAYVLDNASALGVSPEGYSLWGSSAGARMAAAIGTEGVAAYGGAPAGRAPPRPAAVVMAYTGHSAFSPADPPTFAVVGDRDGIAPPAAMERRVADLRRAGVEVEYRRYEGVGHGFGLGTGTPAEGWVDEAVRFWARASRSPVDGTTGR